VPASDVAPTNPARGWVFYLLAALIWSITLGVIPGLNDNASAALSWVRIGAFLGALAGVLAVFVGVGLDVAQDWLGALQSGRNTYSLSRLQMALWTWIILSALMALACCRAWGLGAGDVSTALGIRVSADLFTVMGISYFSAAAAPALLALKTQGPTNPGHQAQVSARTGEPMQVQGSVVSRPADADPRIGDIVQGDDVGSAGTVDLSKVQQLLITLTLVGTYAAMLYGLFAYGPLANAPDKSGETILPVFSQSFVTLLAISHAGYLGYKAAPKPAPTGAAASPASQTGGAKPPPSPDSSPW
jgi:hypothetical protein